MKNLKASPGPFRTGRRKIWENLLRKERKPSQRSTWSGKGNGFKDYRNQNARRGDQSPENSHLNLFTFLYWLLEMRRTKIPPQTHVVGIAERSHAGRDQPHSQRSQQPERSPRHTTGCPLWTQQIQCPGHIAALMESHSASPVKQHFFSAASPYPLALFFPSNLPGSINIS